MAAAPASVMNAHFAHAAQIEQAIKQLDEGASPGRNPMDNDVRKLLEEAWNVPLFEAIFTRRSRRFGLGMEIKRGPNAYKSEAEPLPLSLEEEAMLCMAATGMSGMNLADMPHTRKEDLAEGEDYCLYRPADDGAHMPQVWGRVLKMEPPERLKKVTATSFLY